MSSPTFRPVPAGSGEGTTDHSILDNRDALAQHPGGAITLDTTDFDGNLSASDSTVQAAMETIDGFDIGAGLPVADTTAIVKDPTTATKQMRIDVGAVAAETTRVLTMPNQDVDLTPGTGTFQGADPTLTALAGVSTAANKIPYFTGEDTAAVMDTPERGNLIINGDFSIAQRGTSYTSATWRTNADDSYLLDRWLLLSDGNDIVDVTQIASPFSRSRYALQAEVETANKRFGFCQIIEANSCIPLRGQKISISFAVKTATSKVINNVRVAVLEWTGTADAVTSDVVYNWASDLTFATNWAALNTPANLALTTSEQTFKVENLTVGASCNNLAVFVWVDDTDCAVDDILQLGEVQVVRGSVVPEFVAPWFSTELYQCMKTFQKSYGYSVVPGTDISSNLIGAITLIYPITAVSDYIDRYVIFPVPMRASPSITAYDLLGAASKMSYYASSWASGKSVGVDQTQPNGTRFYSDAATSKKGIAVAYIAEVEL